MKQKWIFYGIFLWILCFSCRSEQESTMNMLGMQIHTQPQAATKLALDAEQLSWTGGDAFSLYDAVGETSLNNYKFDLISAVGSASATFSGQIMNKPDRTCFYAFYPYQQGVLSNLQRKILEVPQLQLQSGDALQSLHAAYFRLSARIPCQGNPASVDVQFNLLNAVWDFQVDASAASAPVKSLEVRILSSDAGSGFLLQTLYNMETGQMNQRAGSTYVSNMRVELDQAIGGIVNLRLSVLPTELGNAVIQYRIATVDGKTYVLNRLPSNVSIEAGKRYQSLISLSEAQEVWGKQVYLENFDKLPVQTDLALANFSGFQPSGPGAADILYEGVGKVSSMYAPPATNGFSGLNHLYLDQSGLGFRVRNVKLGNTRKFTLKWHAMHQGYIFSPADMDVLISLNQGESWQNLEYSGDGAIAWQKCSGEFFFDSECESLEIMFVPKVAQAIRIDDLLLQEGGEGTHLLSSAASSWKYIPGETIVRQNLGSPNPGTFVDYMYPNGLEIMAAGLTGTSAAGYFSATKWSSDGSRYWELIIPIRKELKDSLVLSFVTYSSSTGPRDMVVQYATEWSNFTPISGNTPHIVVPNATNHPVNLKLKLPAGKVLKNGTQLIFRIFPCTNYASGGGMISSSGTNRMAGELWLKKL